MRSFAGFRKPGGVHLKLTISPRVSVTAFSARGMVAALVKPGERVLDRDGAGDAVYGDGDRVAAGVGPKGGVEDGARRARADHQDVRRALLLQDVVEVRVEELVRDAGDDDGLARLGRNLVD